MKKKEIVIVVLLIIFGVIYNAVKKGKVKFIDDFSLYFNEKRLISEQYLEFPQAEKIFPLTSKIAIENQAGEIVINKSADRQIHLLAFFRVYFLDKSDVERISQNALVHTKIENSELKISGEYLSAFPYQRLRIRLQLFVPEGIVLTVSNSEGNVSIRHTGENVFLKQENGSAIIEDIPSSVQVEISQGNLNAKNIAGNVVINAKQADIFLDNVAALRIIGKHGDYSLKRIKNNVFIEHAYGDIALDDAEKIELFGRHSKILVRNIKNGINLTNAFQDTVLENIVGDVQISCRSSKTELRHIRAKNMVIENSFADIAIEDYSGETLNILFKNGNLDFQSKSIADKLNIESRHAKINLVLGVLIDPIFSIKTKHGRIYNHSPIDLEIFQDNDENFANRSGQKPEIVINNTYGDIYLK